MAISDTVVVGANEWAQPADLTGNNWAAINAACPSGDCNSGTGELNGFDLNGWRWASGNEVGNLLYTAVIPGYPGGLVDFLAPDANSSWAPEIFDTLGFRATGSDADGRYLEAYLSDTNILYTSLADILPPSSTQDGVLNLAANPSGTGLGIWLFRPTPPPPAANSTAIPTMGNGWLAVLVIALLVTTARKVKAKKI